MDTSAHLHQNRRKLKFIVSAFVMLTIGVVGYVSFHRFWESTSEFHEAKLQLLRAYKQTNISHESRRERFRNAFEGAGANRLHILESMLSVKSDTYKERLISLVNKQKIFPIEMFSAEDQLKCAILFTRKGEQEARKLIPELTALMSHKSRDVAAMATLALKDLRPDSNPSLIQGLTNSNLEVRWLCASGLKVTQTQAASAVPLLVQCLDQSFPDLPEAALEALGKIKLYPEICIPAMIAKLNSTNYSIQQAAAEALAQFGPHARDAVPRLTTLIEQYSHSPRSTPFKSSLQRIVP